MDAERSLRQLQHTSWTIGEGAPPDVWALAQTPDGFLWLGTGDGLFRFDGVRFERYRPAAGGPFLSTDISALRALPNGDLWIGYAYGGASLLRDGKIRNFQLRDGLPSASVVQIAQDRDGTIWAGTRNGLARFVGGHWHAVGRDWGFPGGEADVVFLARNGTVWVATDRKLLFLKRGTRRFKDTGEALSRYASLTQAPDGGLWLADERFGTRRLPDFERGEKERRVYADTAPPLLLKAKRIVFDRDGNLWGTEASPGGLFKLAHPPREPEAPLRQDQVTDTFRLSDGLSSDISVPLQEDREGNVWIGTNLGLDRFRAADAVSQSAIPATSRVGYFMSPAGDGGTFAIGANTLFEIPPHGAPKTLWHFEVQPFCIFTDHLGVAWFCANGPLAEFKGGRILNVPLPPETAPKSVEAIAEDSQGRLWISVLDKGTYRETNGVWHAIAIRPDPLNTPPNNMTADHRRMWIGYPDGKIALVESEHVRIFGPNDGLAIGAIYTGHVESDGVWFGGDGGIAHFDGRRFSSLSTSAVAALSRVTGIAATPDGDIWINGIRGLVVARAKDLLRAFETGGRSLRYRLLDHNDGLPGVAQQQDNQPSILRASDGRLWIVTNHGIAWIDPARLIRNSLPPPVSILSLTTKGRDYLPMADLTLPQGTSNLKLNFTALSLSIPERVRFRYRLDGVDDNWVDPGMLRTAFYTKLGPGHYRFQVIAANNSGVWNRSGATLAFVIPPTFLQTNMFAAFCGLALLVALWLIYALRLRQMTARMQDRLEVRLAERERIARELHDTLLQGFQGMILRFQSIANRIPKSDALRQALEGELESADAVLAEGRDGVRNLRSTDQSIDIAQIFTATAGRLADDNTPRFRLTVEGTPRPLHPIIREEIEKLGNEAIFNAFRHSRARMIDVAIMYHRAEVQLRIRDDGIGIDADVLAKGGRQGHFGLTGMRERAQKMRARFALSSRPQSGTEIELSVPASVAYSAGRGFATPSRRPRAPVGED